MNTRQHLIDDLFNDGWTFGGLNEQHEMLMQHATMDWMMIVANDWRAGAPLFRNHHGDGRSPLRSDLPS